MTTSADPLLGDHELDAGTAETLAGTAETVATSRATGDGGRPRPHDGDQPGPVALVHDYLLVERGAERTFHAIAECWPHAPVHTLLYDDGAMARRFDGHPVRTSALQRLPVRQKGFRSLLPLFPLAVERMDLGEAELIVSSSSAFAHGVRPSAGAVHVCYSHTPFRYVWHERQRALDEMPRQIRPLGRPLLTALRRWDRAASRRVTHYIANSEVTRQRLAESYGRDAAAIVHPPVETHRFGDAPPDPEPWFLIVGELVRHKNADVALAAAERAGARVKVVGSGPELPSLARRYGRSADFLGRVSDAELDDLYRRSRALLLPAVEEFGITAVESQAAGRPVLAAGEGGALETVVDGHTGLFTSPRDVQGLAEAMHDTDWHAFEPDVMRAQASRFSTQRFQRTFRREVERLAAA
jgi:glycosyltransferase involved in cell wall biosynthesis